MLIKSEVLAGVVGGLAVSVVLTGAAFARSGAVTTASPAASRLPAMVHMSAIDWPRPEKICCNPRSPGCAPCP